ncbi:MAG TPA: winged helix-turn-helix transcriptional regulator [Candidatus Nanoarchaeia archaeon]|nr:winged helix-turn-helix transcriptional regulator [Candidatus Nanoarchaeia archaeon]
MAEINNSRLDRVDRKILSEIETDSRIATSMLARKARVSRTVAEYRLKQMEEKGIIRGYYTLVDPSRFGLTVWKLWISLHSSSLEQKEKFFSYVENHPRIWWYAECAGVYDAVICVLCSSPHDFNNFFSTLQEKHGSMISKSATLINVSFEYHTRGYLLNKPSRLIESSFQEKPLTKKISEDAVKLLKLLSNNSRMKYSELAERSGRNVKTIKNLLKELKKSGIIVYYRPSIDAARFGYEYYKVLLYLNNPRGILPSLVYWCRLQKNITAVISCVGPWQLELEIEIDTFRNLCSLLTELKDKFPDVLRSYETLLLTKEGNFELDLIDRISKLA